MRKKLRLVMILALILTLLIPAGRVSAEENEYQRVVRVAFFPMEGYHIFNWRDNTYEGIEAEYLQAICEYTDWKIQYVTCDSWQEALDKLENESVDLVGTAQFSQERAEVFDYASLSSGYTFGAIATNGDRDVAYEDFRKMEHLTYGMVKDYVRSDEFYEYMAKNGIEEPKVLEYENTKKLQDAIAAGEIDAIVHSFMEVQEGQRLIGRFAASPTYYITYKGNKELLAELNDAIMNVNLNYPNLQDELMTEFYKNKWDSTVLYTLKEQEYIASQPEITVGYLPDFYPFSYEENGEFKGLAREILENRFGNLEFKYQKIDKLEKALYELEEGNVDILAYYTDTELVRRREKVHLLNSYADVPYVVVMPKEHKLEDVKRLAIPFEFVDNTGSLLDMSNMELLYGETAEKCMNLVIDGKADAALVGSYNAEMLIRTRIKYNNLTIANVLNGEFRVHMVMRRGMPAELESIFDKSLTMLSDQTINEYTLQMNIYPLVSMQYFFEHHSGQIVLTLVLLILIILFVGMHFILSGRKIQKLLYKDTSMDIWNLHYFILHGERLVDTDKRNYAVVTLNIMKLRQYIVIYGRKGREKLFDAVRVTLKQSVNHKTEICARGDNDHFVLLLEYNEWEELMERLVKLKEAVEASIFEATENHLQIEFGVCAISEFRNAFHTYVDSSVQALEDNENKAVNDIRVYDGAFRNLLKSRHEKEKMLDEIQIEECCVTYYQAKVDIRTEEIVGAEALIRMIDPVDGSIRTPWYFVPYFEEKGRIVEIDFFVLRSVCQMLRRRLDAGERVVPISCNFSRRHFIIPGFAERFEAVLAEYGIDKNLIEVEITETLVVEQMQLQMITQNLGEMHKRGIRLSIDDFGSGYSSLGMFEHIPASVIKLDRSFMLSHENPERQVKIMRGIVKLSDELDAQIVCEGVETSDDVALMREINAHVAQGYFYSKPIPEADFEAKL